LRKERREQRWLRPSKKKQKKKRKSAPTCSNWRKKGRCMQKSTFGHKKSAGALSNSKNCKVLVLRDAKEEKRRKGEGKALK